MRSVGLGSRRPTPVQHRCQVIATYATSVGRLSGRLSDQTHGGASESLDESPPRAPRRTVDVHGTDQ